ATPDPPLGPPSARGSATRRLAARSDLRMRLNMTRWEDGVVEEPRKRKLCSCWDVTKRSLAMSRRTSDARRERGRVRIMPPPGPKGRNSARLSCLPELGKRLSDRNPDVSSD